MIGKNKGKSYDKLIATMENDINTRFPTISNHIHAVRVEKGSEHPIGADVRSAGIFMQCDSNVCTKEALPLGAVRRDAIVKKVSDSAKAYIDRSMASLMAGGMSEADAQKKVQDSLVPMMGYDARNRQYVMCACAPGADGKVCDSLLEQTSIPMWNIGWMTKILKQPFATSHAKNLVSVESFSNPWADVIGLFKESFEGYGKLSTVAKGNVKQNNSNPVTNEASQIVSEVFNLSVDYESDVMEDIKAQQPGNFITGQIKADREKYATMVLDRMADSLIYFGSKEAGIDGLVDVADVEMYTGTPLYDLMNSGDPAPGAKIVLAMNKLIGDFLRENHYMARELRINVSEYVFQALTQTVYSEVYDPSSPFKVLSGNFKGTSELDGGLVQCKYTIVSDSMLNPNTPWNPNSYDLMFMTVPSISDALTGVQDSLVIHPELLKNYVVPALWQRSGILMSRYRRVGGIIAPIEGTVRCIAGIGKAD